MRWTRLYRASNPMLAAHTAGLFLFGAGVGWYSGLAQPAAGLWAALALYFVWFATCETMFTVLLNNYFDREEDAHNPRKARFEAVYDDSLFWPYWTAIVAALALFFVPFGFHSDLKVLAYVLLLVVANWAYDAPPLRVKTRPPLDVLVGACTQVLPPVFAAYALVSGHWPAAWAVAAAACALCNFELFHKTFDIEADVRMRLQTTATVLGLRASLLVCLGLQLLAGACIAAGTGEPRWCLALAPYLVMLAAAWYWRAEEPRRALYWYVQRGYFAAGVIITAFLYI